jgi:hypothetical protein
MNVISFRPARVAIPFYQRAVSNHTLVSKRLVGRQRVRGYVQRIDDFSEAGIQDGHPATIVHLSIEEVEGGFDGQRLPRGYTYGPLPAPPEEQVRFQHYAIRTGDTVFLDYEAIPGLEDVRALSNSYIKPSLKSIRFRVPEQYIKGFLALYKSTLRTFIRLEDNSRDVSGFVNYVNREDRQVEVQVTAHEQERGTWTVKAPDAPKSPVMLAISKTLGVPYDQLVADPPYGNKSWITPQAGYANGILRTGTMSFAFNHLKENDMKIFDAVIVKTDDKGTPTEIAKVVAPFLAKDEAAAKMAVTVDYATENQIAGKDLTGIAVLVRPFQVGF